MALLCRRSTIVYRVGGADKPIKRTFMMLTSTTEYIWACKPFSHLIVGQMDAYSFCQFEGCKMAARQAYSVHARLCARPRTR